MLNAHGKWKMQFEIEPDKAAEPIVKSKKDLKTAADKAHYVRDNGHIKYLELAD